MKVADLYTYEWPHNKFHVKVKVWNKNGDVYKKSFAGEKKDNDVKFNASKKNLMANYDKVEIVSITKR